MRRATSADRRLLESLVGVGLTELASGRGGRAYVDDLSRRLAASENLTDAIVEAVIHHGVVHGQAFGVVVEGLALLYVSPDVRRTRIGTAIYELLVAEGPVELWAKPGDRATKSFAESLGLKARLLIMSGENSDES